MTLIESNRDKLTLYTLSPDRRRLDKLWATSLSNVIWLVDRAVIIGDELLVPGHDDTRYIVAGYGEQNGNRVTTIVPKDVSLGPAETHFLSIRRNRLLIEVGANGFVEVFELDFAGNARLVISTSPGPGAELCGELLGFSVLGNSYKDMLDACPTCDLKLRAPNCRLANLSKLDMAAWLLGPNRPPLIRVTEDNILRNASPVDNIFITVKPPCQFVIAPEGGKSIYFFNPNQHGLGLVPEDTWYKLCHSTFH